MRADMRELANQMQYNVVDYKIVVDDALAPLADLKKGDKISKTISGKIETALRRITKAPGDKKAKVQGAASTNKADGQNSADKNAKKPYEDCKAFSAS